MTADVLVARVRALLDYIGSPENCADCAVCFAEDGWTCGLHDHWTDVLRELPPDDRKATHGS